MSGPRANARRGRDGSTTVAVTMADGINENEARDGADSSHVRTLAQLVKGKNIHEETLLATDYLNHFNEIIMLLDMIPGMPECLEDAKAWEPKTYVGYRRPFESVIAHINDLAAEGVAEVAKALETGEQGRIEETVATISRNLQKFIDVASAIIHGDARTMDQAEIDSIIMG
jgi:hypothetical protein